MPHFQARIQTILVCGSRIRIRNTVFYLLSLLLGVFTRAGGVPVSLDHSPRDFLPVENSYQEPSYCTNNVLDAVELIFKKEFYH